MKQRYIYYCTNCDYETFESLPNCPKCTGYMKSKENLQFNPAIILGLVCLAFLILANLSSFVQDVYFHFTHINPIVSYEDEPPIDPYKEPIQINYADESWTFKHPTSIGDFTLIPKAKYNQAGRVVAINTNFWLRDFMRSEFDRAFLIDLGIVWGELANPNSDRYLGYKSEKDLGDGRVLWTKYKTSTLPYSWPYINAHIAHNHIIPANDNVMSALYIIKIDDIVELEGYLVDSIYPSGYRDETSLSRTDEGANTATRTGKGSCERIYVTKVKLGNKVYE